MRCRAGLRDGPVRCGLCERRSAAAAVVAFVVEAVAAFTEAAVAFVVVDGFHGGGGFRGGGFSGGGFRGGGFQGGLSAEGFVAAACISAEHASVAAARLPQDLILLRA